MSKRFEEKSAKVIVVDSSGAVRQLLTDVVRTAGFANIQGVATLKDALSIFEVEEVDWLVTPLVTDPVNAFQVLELITKQYQLQRIRVSLVVEEAEKDILPAAYEKGLFSHFEKPFNKDTLKQAISTLVERLAQNEWNEPKVAASYLRQYCAEHQLYKTKLSLEKGLLQAFPGNGGFLVEMAICQAKLGMTDPAKLALRQAVALDSNLTKKVEETAKTLFGDDAKLNEPAKEGETFNVLGLKNTVIVDSDETNRKALSKVLKGLGVEEVLEFEDGDAAWNWLSSNTEPNLIIQEWRIPKLTGPLLVQRVRKRFPCVPIVTVSSLLTQDDHVLVKEIGVSAIVNKPVDAAEFLTTIVRVIQQERAPTDADVLETKIRQLLEAGRNKEAAKYGERYNALTALPEGRKKKIAAEFAYAEKKYALARDLAVESIKLHADSLGALNFLGKCLMKLRDFEAALKCLERAQKLSPMNIQRLCSIAEANNELGDTAGADKALEAAKKVDGGNETVAEAEAQIRISNGDVNEAKAIIGQMQSLQNVISYMNNKAVAHSRGGQIAEGIEIYKKTLASVPDDKPATQAIVGYNLALALARKGDLQDAMTHLDQVIALGDSLVLAKSKSLQKRVKQALDSHSQLVFQAAKQEATHGHEGEGADGEARLSDGGQDHEAHLSIVANLESQPGDICCYRIFVNPEAANAKAVDMIKTMPHFVRRKTIEREESAGVEKALKS